MRRSHLGLGIVVLVCAACGSSAQQGEEPLASSVSALTPATADAGADSGSVSTTPADSCTANTIAWTVTTQAVSGACSGIPALKLTPAESTCAGGFEYSPYVSPCYAECCGDGNA